MSDLVQFQPIENPAERRALQLERHRLYQIDIHRDWLNRHLKNMSNEAEKAQDYMRRLIREGEDVSDELDEMLQAGLALQIVAGTMRMAMERNQSEAAE